MAFPLKSLSFAFLILLLLLLQLSSDCLNGGEKSFSCVAAIKEQGNRKVGVFKIDGMKKTKEEEEYGWELRAAPLGPDPLHHHGLDPKRPRTP